MSEYYFSTKRIVFLFLLLMILGATAKKVTVTITHRDVLKVHPATMASKNQRKSPAKQNYW